MSKGKKKTTRTGKPPGPEACAGQAQLLKICKGNAKLKEVYYWCLPAGHSCPGALECLAKADRHTGRVTDGPDTKIRCWAASMEGRQ